MNKKDAIELANLFNEFLADTAGEDLCPDCCWNRDPEGRQRKHHCKRTGKVIHDGDGICCGYYGGPEFDDYVREHAPELAERIG